MAQGKFIAYYRVSTAQQGRSGLGLDAQRTAVESFLNGGQWQLIAEFQDIESGRKNDRPELAKAIQRCRLTGAKLIIAKLDRLSRNAAFLLNLRDAGVEFVAADMPTANSLTVGIMALVAEEEARAISARTKVALAAAKARGVKLGNPNGFTGERKPELAAAARVRHADAFAAKVGPIMQQLKAEGLSLRAIVARLNELGIRTARGGQWQATTIKNALDRLG